jgi:hypothetical protein
LRTGLQLLQGELDTEGEEQQGDPDLGQELDVVGIMDQPSAGDRAQQDSGGDVAQDQGAA